MIASLCVSFCAATYFPAQEVFPASVFFVESETFIGIIAQTKIHTNQQTDKQTSKICFKKNQEETVN